MPHCFVGFMTAGEFLQQRQMKDQGFRMLRESCKVVK